MNGPSPPHTPAGGPRGGEGVAPVCLVATRDIWLRRRHREARSLGDTPVERAAPVSLPSGPPLLPGEGPGRPACPGRFPNGDAPGPGSPLLAPSTGLEQPGPQGREQWPRLCPESPGQRAAACGAFLALLLCPQRNVRTSVGPRQHKCLHGACPPSPAVVTRRPRSVCVSCLCQAQGRAASEMGRFRGTSESWCVRLMGLTSGVLSRLVLTLQV